MILSSGQRILFPRTCNNLAACVRPAENTPAQSGGRFHKAASLRKSLGQPVTAERGRTRILCVCCAMVSILSGYLYIHASKAGADETQCVV